MICAVCGENKPEVEFYKTGQSFGGKVWRRRECRDCVNEARRLWRLRQKNWQLNAVRGLIAS